MNTLLNSFIVPDSPHILTVVSTDGILLLWSLWMDLTGLCYSSFPAGTLSRTCGAVAERKAIQISPQSSSVPPSQSVV